MFTAVIDYILFITCLFILAGSLYITIKMRFVQLRCFPLLFKMLKESILTRSHKDKHTLLPHKALMTAMSTTLGISTIVAPVIAISLGGPGALFGFLLTAFFGSAATYAEVNLSVQHRQRAENGSIMGGPMQYLKTLISPAAAKFYALGCLLLMSVWSAAQANQLAAILDSPLLGDYRVPTYLTGIITAGLVLMAMLGGVKRIGSLSSKLVPLMFVLYLSSALWIIFCNVDKLGAIFRLMFQSALAPQSLASGAIVGGVVSALRWGIFKGVQTTEAGVGTQAIPHAMADTKDPVAQGALAMFSTYTAGIVAFLSGIVALITNTWQDPSLPLGISMVAASFQQYFSYFGVAIVAISALLFGFGTILGNSFNGSQCFLYLMSQKKSRYYLLLTTVMIFFGAIGEVTTVWSLIDVVLAALVIPHMGALILHTRKEASKEVSVLSKG